MRLLRTSNIVGRRLRLTSARGDGDFVSAMVKKSEEGASRGKSRRGKLSELDALEVGFHAGGRDEITIQQ